MVIRPETRGQRWRIKILPICAIAPAMLANSSHRILTAPLTVVALSLILAVLFLLLALLAIVALTAVFARQAHTRRAATRILDLLLRLAPWYASRRRDS